VRLPLERQKDVDKGCEGLNKWLVLRMVNEIALAALVLRKPRYDVELRSAWSLPLASSSWRAIDAGESCILE
jgi:hypothetical protein